MAIKKVVKLEPKPEPIAKVKRFDAPAVCVKCRFSNKREMRRGNKYCLSPNANLLNGDCKAALPFATRRGGKVPE